MTSTPYPAAPGQSGGIDNLQALLGLGAFRVADNSQGSGTGFGQNITETFVRSLITSQAMNMGAGDGSLSAIMTNLTTYLEQLELSSLKWLQPYIPGATDDDFSTVDGAVQAILQALDIQLLMGVSDFTQWLHDIFDPNSALWSDAKAKWDALMGMLSSYPPFGSSAATVAVWWSNLLVALGLDPTTSAFIANIISGNYDWAKQSKAWLDQILSALGLSSGTDVGNAIGANTTNIATQTSVLNQISDIFNGLVVTPINTAVQQIKDWWNNLWAPQTATVAQTVVNVKNAQSFQISAITSGYRNPAWVCRYPVGDVAYPESQNSGLLVYDQAGSPAPPSGANIPYRALPAAYVITQNQSRGGYIAISNTVVMDTVGFIVSWNGVALTANSIFMEVFRENSDGSLTRIYSFDITSSLVAGIQYVERTLSPGLIANAGERYLVRLRNISSTGQIGLQGLDLNPTSVKAAHYTTSAAATNVSSYSAADAATYSTGIFAWGLLASKSGTATDQLYSDDFNRSALGSLWFLQSTTANQLGITANTAGYQGTTAGTQRGLYVRPTASDRMWVEGSLYNNTLVVTGTQQGLILNANRDLSQMVALLVNNSSAKIYSGPSGSLTQRATVSTLLNDVPWQFYYNPATNTYTALKNGQSIGLSWLDSGNLMAHNANTRYGGLQLARDGSGFNSGNIDSWLLQDWS